MSDILCRWLNDELRLSQIVEPKTFAKNFCSGYLIGEVLHKYQLLKDFSMFTQKDTSTSNLSNFTRLEPSLKLLGISFDMNTAQELMQEKQGVATHLLYQLYVSLEKMKKTPIDRTVMETVQPAANATMNKKERDNDSDRMHPAVKHDAELKLQKISQHCDKRRQHLNVSSVMTHPVQQKRQLKVQDVHRMQNPEKVIGMQVECSSVCTFNKISIIQVPTPLLCTLQLNLKRRKQQQQLKAQQAQVQTVQNEIAQFEANRKKLVTCDFASSTSGNRSPGEGSDVRGSGTKVILQSSSKYIEDIRQRLRENAAACEQREKRRDRFLALQREAHEAQEEAWREEQLVKRLTRQTQQEQRLAAHLLQIRSQKEVMRQNRLFSEQQYQQRRERDFQEALEKEAALAQQVTLERAEDIRKELEFLNKITARRTQSRHEKHFAICKDILEQIVDLATKVGEYRRLTANLIPGKLMREWKELLFKGLPLYEPSTIQPRSDFSTTTDPVELEKQEILNNQDFDEYANMVGEWAWPEEAGETKVPPTNNNILGHVIGRLRRFVPHPHMDSTVTPFPHFTLKACVLGKFCSGKSTCLAKIAKDHDIHVISADKLIDDVLNAYKNGEKLSARAMLGATVEKELRRGNAVPNELLVNIIAEAIRQIPPQSSWILDGFPSDIIQAHLLEKAFCDSVDVGTVVINNRANLAVDPNPPKPPPPPSPALDLALLLDVPDECVVRRALSHTDSAASTDKTLYLAQIQHRITAFQDTWPKLEKWFGAHQNILTCVDADVEEDKLHKRIESVLQQVMMKTKETPSPVEDGESAGQNAAESSSSATPPPVDQPPPLKDEASGQNESHSSLNGDKAQTELLKSTAKSPRGLSRKVSSSSVTLQDSPGAPENPPESASPCPGSSSWVYVDEPIPTEIPEYLCSHWNTMCDSYVNNVKTVMQQLRSQHTAIDHHLDNIREAYKHYLGHPDLKQEVVLQWQKDFNRLRDDMREDEETKAELHLRLDELCERLWDITEKRKEEAEQEMAAVMDEGWLEEHTMVFVNHHSILLQVELNRFQATLCILRVYYLSMYNQVLPEQQPNFGSITLLKTPETEDPRCPDSPRGVSETKGQDQKDSIKPPHEKLMSDYEEAFTGISKLVCAEVQQIETNEQEERMQEKEPSKDSGSAKKVRKQPSKKQKGQLSSCPESSPAATDDKKNHDQEVKQKIHKEYVAALYHEENAVKVRIALLNGRGLAMVQSLKSRAEQTRSSLQKWSEEHYLAEMQSIEQLSEVVRHHIEADAKLQNELVLECTDFYLNGGYQMVASPLTPPRPPCLEKPMQSTPTICQLESLHRQLYTVAPAGLMSSLEFSSLLRDIVSVNMGDALPEPWINKTETQVMEIVSLLKDELDLIDWRRFLLSAALPWPFPSLSQLLAVLQRFKAADAGSTGFINEEQYLQTELWFSHDGVHPVPEDPSEPLHYDRLANLRKFFFKLFADQSWSPPRMEYVSMLQYFAADPHPRQGFIRALSVILGQHLKLSSPESHLVTCMQSMPAAEEPAVLSSELDGEDTEEEIPGVSLISVRKQEVSIPALLDVICHKVTRMKDVSLFPPGCLSQEEHAEHLVQIFRELGYEPEEHVPISVLSQHPFIQGLMETSLHYQLVDIHRVLLSKQDEGEPNGQTPS
ncbi:sperm flagellar protein 2 [Brachionichthys hirsutus]|uniref:sperm flagellar protein 2 n=1 Tax=Brachionichthys hirsutus TaxID=412623 RepID=UPI0036049EDA